MFVEYGTTSMDYGIPFYPLIQQDTFSEAGTSLPLLALLACHKKLPFGRYRGILRAHDLNRGECVPVGSLLVRIK